MRRYALLPIEDVAHILALEEWLLRNGKENILLLWSGSRAVILGKYQEVECETDRAFLERQGISLYRRFSGGGTVYIDEGTLLYSYIGEREQMSFSDCSQDVRSFLDCIGIEVDVDERLSLFYKEKKVSGVAQSVYKDRMLFHGTLLVKTDLNMLEYALRPQVCNRQPKIPSVRSEVANIGGDRAEVLRAWDYFLASKGINTIPPEEVKLLLKEEGVIQLKENKYSQSEWTLAT